MLIGLTIEGKNDKILQTIIKKLAMREVVFEVSFHRGFGDLLRSIKADLKYFAYREVNLIVIIGDNDCNPRGERLKMMLREVQRIPLPDGTFVIAVAIETIEAWLLCDERALSSVSTKRIQTQSNAEKIENPKALLKELTEWHTMGKPYGEIIEEIAQKMDLHLVRKRSASFDRFAKDFKRALK